MFIKAVFVHILDFIFPKRCLKCGKVGKYFCLQCRGSIKIVGDNEHICPVCEKLAIGGTTHPKCRTRYTIDGLTSFFRYDGIVKNAVKSIKYRFVSDLAREFITLIPSYSLNPLVKPPANGATVIIPIPLHPARERFRGFNQAEVLSRMLARYLRVSVETHALKRTKQTTPQVAMKKREDRLKNMEHVFSVNEKIASRYKNSRVFLFDDVFTTGATIRSATSVLKRAGVQYVWGITMAR
jgi:ComF family protein